MASKSPQDDRQYVEAIQKTLGKIVENMDPGTMEQIIIHMFEKEHISRITVDILDDTDLRIKKVYRLFDALSDCDNKSGMFEDFCYCIDKFMVRPDIAKIMRDSLDEESKEMDENSEYLTENDFIKLLTKKPKTTDKMDIVHETPDDLSEDLTELMKAVMREDIERVSIIIKEDRNSLNKTALKTKKTALIFAVERKNIDILKLLLKQSSINANLRDKDGLTAFMHTLLTGDIDSINVMVKSEKVDIFMGTSLFNISGICYAWGIRKLVDLLGPIISTRQYKVAMLKQHYDDINKLKSKINITQVVNTFTTLKNLLADKMKLLLLHVIQPVMIMGYPEIFYVFQDFMDPESINVNFLYGNVDYYIALSIITENEAAYNTLSQFTVNEDKIAKFITIYGDKQISKEALKKLKRIPELRKFVLTIQVIEPDTLEYLLPHLKTSFHEHLQQKDSDGNTFLLLVCGYCHPQVAVSLCEKLDKQVINTKNKFGLNALIMFCLRNNKHNAAMLVVSRLIDKGSEVNAVDMHGASALMIASEKGNCQVARLLMEKGAKVNIQDKFGWTTLMKASARGFCDCAILLINKGAEVNAVNNRGSTALMWASKGDHSDMATVLIDKGANVNAVNNGGTVALMWASKQGHCDVASLLIKNGAKVNAVSNVGWSSLMFASEEGHCDMARLLITKGAEVNAVNIDGWTALMLASEQGYCDVVSLLIDNSAREPEVPDGGK